MRVQRQIDRLLAQRAAEWVDVLNDGSREDHAAFLDWLRQSKLHVEHYLETEALDRQIRALAPSRGPNLETVLSRISPSVPKLKNASDASEKPTRRAWRTAWALAATFAVIAFGTVLGIRHFTSPANRVVTAVGEQRNMTLPDGSRIFVNALSEVRVRYSQVERTIELESGEAVFQVARDPTRPFTVRTKTAHVRAIGTQFNVYQKVDDTALVSVVEGRVQVTRLIPDAGRGGAPLKSAETEDLGTGEEAQVTPQRIERRAHPDVAKTLGWREGRLYFDETPLEEMALEFNRYGGPLVLRLEDVPPGRYRFGGVFNANEPETLVDILERQKDFTIERRPDGVVVIRAAPAAH